MAEWGNLLMVFRDLTAMTFFLLCEIFIKNG